MTTDVSARDRKAAQIWLMKMLDDPVGNAEAFDRWASGAPGRLDYYENLLGALQGADRAARELHVEQRIVPTRRPVRVAIKPAFAALLIGALSIPVIAGLYWPAYHAPDSAPVSERSYATQIGEVRTEKLVDGSTAILDTNSEMAVRIDGDQRRIVLKRGRVRFIVAHDETRKFMVQAGESEVTATGTMFDVILRDGFQIHLLQGGVDVTIARRADGGKSSQKLHLRPGQQLIFNRDTAGPSPSLSSAPDTAWISGLRRFDDVPISTVIAEANSYSRKKIVLANSALGDRRIIADINIRNDEAVAKAIADYLQLQVDRSQSDRLILVAAR